MIPFVSRRALRRKSVLRFVAALSERHPEMRQTVTWEAFEAIARRERIVVMLGVLSRPGRLVRIGDHAYIQLDRRQTLAARTTAAMHELCHFWRDDPGEVCYHVEDDIESSDAENFADVFAWVTTSPAGVFLRHDGANGDF